MSEKYFCNADVRLALQEVETAGLRAITSVEGIHARIIAPFEDSIWDWFTTNTGIYNVTDHEGKFGEKGSLVNIVAHGFGPLSSSQRISELKTSEYFKKKEKIQLNKEEEKILLNPTNGVPVYDFNTFLEISEDKNFIRNNPLFGVVRNKETIINTLHYLQEPHKLCNNSSAIILAGGREPAKQYIGQAIKKRDFDRYGVWCTAGEGGRLIRLGDGNINVGLFGYLDGLTYYEGGRFIGR